MLWILLILLYGCDSQFHNTLGYSDYEWSRFSNDEKNKLIELRKFVEKNFEYVGKDFSRKVREIYYDKKNKKMIYGTTTPEEKEELEDEGINLLSVPWVSKNN